MTFAQVYDKWLSDPLEQYSPKTVNTWSSAFTACKALHNLPIAPLKVDILEETIVNACNMKGEPASLHMKNRIKSLYNHMYRYALRHDIVSKNYAKLVKSPGQPNPMIKRTPFSAKERKMLFDHLDFPFVSMVLIGIYSGFRPSEFCELKTENIDLKSGTMRGGIKTKAGINRLVPIHSKIAPLVAS